MSGYAPGSPGEGGARQLRYLVVETALEKPLRMQRLTDLITQAARDSESSRATR